MKNAQQAKVALVEKLDEKQVTAQEMAADIAANNPAKEKDIKDLLDLIAFVEAVAVTIIEAVADGVDPLDVLALVNDDEVRDTLSPALSNVEDVGPEVMALTSDQLFQLMHRLVDFAKELYRSITGSFGG